MVAAMFARLSGVVGVALVSLVAMSHLAAADECARPVVCFTPGEACTDRVVAAIQGAQRDILVQAYSFTAPAIAAALIEAHQRGVEVRVVVDAGEARDRRSQAARLAQAGVPVRVDGRHAIAHNKVMVLDGRVVLTGSFNFTTAAQQHNAENLLVVEDAALAARYAANWQRHWAHAEAWRP
jgi:phosphatidylserine/phosphatidylglycerophosphate/cardiolipin synthase-like enzyme